MEQFMDDQKKPVPAQDDSPSSRIEIERKDIALDAIAHETERKDMTLDEYASKIKAEWRNLTAGIISVGKLLIRAKRKVGKYGDWQDWIENKLPFGIGTAQALMRIARHPILSNAQHAELLPACWATLDLLRKDDKLQQHLDDGTITARMTREEAIQLLQGAPPRPDNDRTTKGEALSIAAIINDYLELQDRYPDPSALRQLMDGPHGHKFKLEPHLERAAENAPNWDAGYWKHYQEWRKAEVAQLELENA